jgi:hypothetical protein
MWAVVLLPVVVTYCLLARLATAVPIIDDYPHIFRFALNFQAAPTLADKLRVLLLTQVGPYKLIFDHALVALQLMVFGRLNFPVLIVLGNLTPLGIFALLWRNAELGPRRRLILLLPVSLLLFGLNYAETLDWAISGLQQPAVILFALASIHFLVKRERGTRDAALACGFGLLASATYANGMIVWPVGLLFLVLQDRRVGRLVSWCAAFAVMLGVYLYHYVPEPTAHASMVGKVVFFAMFCGGALENMHHRPVPYVSVAIGVVVMATFVHAVRTRYDRRSPFFFYSAVWMLLTGVVVANARMWMGLQLSLSSRYKIYCDLLLVFGYEYLLDRVYGERVAEGSRRWWLRAAFVGAVVVFVAGDVAGAKLLSVRRGRAEAAMQRYLLAPESASPMFVVEDVLSAGEILDQDHARMELNEAIRLGIYTPPKFPAKDGMRTQVRAEKFGGAVGGVYPAAVLAAAYRATAAWGTIVLGPGRYVSPFGCGLYRSPRRLVGAGRPGVDDERHPQRLVGGTVLLGEVCGTAPIVMEHLGVDAGADVVREVYGGVAMNGIYLPSHGAFNPKRGTRLEDVAVLTTGMANEHTVLLEGEEGAVVQGLWVWSTGGTHGLIVKSGHTTVRDYHCKGASADCLLVKSDYRTAGNGYAGDDQFEGVDIGYLVTPGDTGGITLDATWDSVEGITFADVREEGLADGIVGAGSWFHTLRDVRIEGWRARGIAGRCAAFVHSARVTMTDFDCEAARPADSLRGSSMVYRPARRGWKDAAREIKPSLRIVWETAKTSVGRGVAWVREKV